MPPFVAEIPKARGVRVGPFAGRLREPVLVDPKRPVAGDAEIAKDGEPPDTLEDVGGIGCSTGPPQPAEMRQPGVGMGSQQFIQLGPLPETEVDGQRPVCLATGPMSHGRSQTVEHGEGRRQDASPPQIVQEGFDQREATIRVACQHDQPSRHLTVFRQTERSPPEHGEQLGQMLFAGLISSGIPGQPFRADADLIGDEPQHRGWYRFIRGPGTAGVTEERELDLKAQTVRFATALGDQIEVRRRERIALGDLPDVGRQHQELSSLGGGEDLLSGHECSCRIGGCTVWL
jgi:hypothetical protein